MSRRAVQLVTLLALSLALGACVAANVALGAFRSTAAASAGNVIAAAPDFVPPQATATTIARSGGPIPGAIRAGGVYFVYANVVDSGSPASGVAAVSANLSAVTGGQIAVTLNQGSYSVGGVSYNRRSAALTASKFLADGTVAYSLTMSDGAGNSATENGFAVTIDSTPIAAADVQTENGSASAGRAQQGDRIVYSFSEPPDPESILAHWDGSAAEVVVRLNNAKPDDTVTIYDENNKSELPFGTLYLGRKDYTNANRTFGVKGSASTMVLSGDQVTITLGGQSGNAKAGKASGTMEWRPSSGPTDAAGNSMSTGAAEESGKGDREF